MRKLLLSFLVFLMFIPFIVHAETCNPDKISISSIAIEESSDNVTEINEATASGKNINVSLSMSEVGDSIKYKVIFKNDSDEDYELDKNSLHLSSDYIDYVLESEDNSNIVKANSSKVVYLKVNYANEVPEDKFESGTFNDNKTMTFNLTTDDTLSVLDAVNNPKTGNHFYVVILVITLLVSSTLYLIFRKNKYAIFMVLIVGVSMIISISVHALCKIEIKVESNIQINYLDSFFCLHDDRSIVYYIPYRDGMTWTEFDDYIIENNQKIKVYSLNENSKLVENGYLKRYTNETNRKADYYEYSDFFIPVDEHYNPEFLYDDFFAFGRGFKKDIQAFSYSYPNEYWYIDNLEMLYPEEYSKMATDEYWWSWNDNIFNAKYGCYYFNGG